MCKNEKRFRPTLGQYRELEKENEALRMMCNADGCYDKRLEAERNEWKRKFEEQLEGTSVVVADCDAWREKYRRLDDECSVLKKSNKSMEDELKRLNESLKDAVDKKTILEDTVYELRSRGFWARVFNK